MFLEVLALHGSGGVDPFADGHFADATFADRHLLISTNAYATLADGTVDYT